MTLCVRAALLLYTKVNTMNARKNAILSALIFTSMLVSAPAFAADDAPGLESYWGIVLVGNIIFWGILFCIWYFARYIYPSWEARVISDQQARSEASASSDSGE